MTTRTLPKITDRLPLGKTGLHVSPFCNGLVGDPKVITAEYEAGINFFFMTADMHWPVYDNTRKGLQMLFETHPAARDEIVVGLVCYVTQPEFNYAPYMEVLDVLSPMQR